MTGAVTQETSMTGRKATAPHSAPAAAPSEEGR
jgi:hypothetical protein